MINQKTILFIEDDSLIVKLYTTRLELEGFKVFWVDNGQEGIDKFSKLQPNLVVLDLMIPRVSGIDVLQAIRKQDKKVPIIIYTVLSDKKRVQELKIKGATDYFIKADTHPKQLVERIKSYF
ncbi:hypothetical protein A3J78_00770 [Candidatus Beckwithbacteria bacterium RBG_13_35_6]|uniref:Response regulatory domain-containing protein n=1 Tax=Candidatus Beckwithbacteria bacterium RBG_13_35_6 TaxID=1797456 RepID=A0A1F5DIF6_9BACT|nr:MAG: hypothetical protein A3J78_00770 [Candidatus Beckwithbacteria bacterium RBG_13_35_6]